MNHKNDERTVNCPVEGCDATPLARGINLHIRRSSGGGHGPPGDVPDHISLDDLETVGNREVEMDYPEQRDTEDTVRLCPYCSQPFEGKNGVLIHLGQVAGRKNHPEDADEKHSEEDFPVVEVDERGNVTRVAEQSVDTGIEDTEEGTVPVQQVYRLLAELIAENQQQAAQRVRRRLLGDSDVSRPVRDSPPNRHLYDALLKERYAESSEQNITAAVEQEGIMVACGGESAFYTADEARDVAAGLEQSIDEDTSVEEMADLIEFLRYGADKLDDTTMRGSFHEEFQRWR